MPCTVIDLPGGGHAIIRHAAKPPRCCSVCHRKTADYRLCDHPVLGYKRKTCDAVLCKSCAHHVEPDTDYCPIHAKAVTGRLKF